MAGNSQSLEDFLKDTPASGVPAPVGVPAATPAPVQSLDDFLKNGDQSAPTPATLRNNLQFSMDAQPDKEAQYQHLARFVGVPTDTVRAQPDAIKAQASLKQFDADKVTSQFPTTAKVLSDMDNTRMLHDDIPNMTAIEGAMAAPKTSTWEDVKGAPMAFAQGLGGSANQLAKNFNLVLGALPTLADKLGGGTAASDWWFRNMVAPLEARQQAFETNLQTGAPLTGMVPKSAHAVGGLLGMLSQIPVSGEATELPATAGALDALSAAILHATKSMSVPAASAAVGTGSDVYAATSNPQAAMRAAVGQYVASTAQGVLPLSAPGGLLTRAAGGALSFPLVSEVSRQAMNALLPPAMQQPFDIQDVAINAIMGGVMGGVMGPRAAPDAHAAARETYARAVEADTAAQDAQRVAGLSQLFAASKFRERDPEQFRQFVADVADRTGTPDLYIDAKQFAAVLDQSGIPADELTRALPDTAKQMREGLQTEGMVRIPVEDYAQKIAGGPMDEALQPHLRTSPDGMTFGEAKTYYQGQADELKAQAEKASGERAQDEAFKQSGQQVEDTVRDQLDKAGRFPTDVNKAYASMWRSFFETTASKTGQLPHELMAQYPTEVRSEHLPGAATLSQPAAPAERTVSVPGFGDVKFSQAHDVELLGGSSNDGSTVYADKDWNPVAKLRMADGSVKDIDRSPFLGVHELRERQLEDSGWSYTKAHNQAERKEDAAVRAVGIDPKSYQESYDNEIKNAAKKANTGNPPPDLVAKPYEHPDSTRAREALGRVEGAEGEKRTYNQPGDGEKEPPRGEITFNPKDITQGASIALSHDADLSTFLHESGHFFLEVYSDLASKMGAESSIGKDMQTLLDSFGVKDVATWRGMSMDAKRDFHEQFARGFEQYLMEGKAPTLALQSLYGRFRAWLVNVYKSVAELRSSLSQDVRGVMDRMLASQNAIEETQAARGMLPLFDAKPESMDETTWGKYQDELRESTEQAINDLQTKSIRDMQWQSNAKDKAIRALQREAKAARADIRAKVEKEVEAMPLYKAERFLRTGETEGPNGEEIKAQQGFKLNTDDLRRMAQPVDLADLKGLVSPDGLHPDLVAGMFGFGSGDALVRQLAGREPRKDLIEGLTDQRMLEQHGELTDQRSIERAAEAAIHNDVRTRVLARELNALAKATGPARLLAKAAGEAADAAINARQIRAINPRQFQVQEGRAGKAALDALKKGDTEMAAVQKRAQILNNQLAAKARDAQDMVTKALTYFKRFDRISTLKAIDPEDRGQILKLLDNYDFRANPTDEATRAQKNIQQWLESQQAAGYSPLVDDAALRAQPRTEYRDMTVEALRGLYDTVRSMEKIGRDKKSADWEGQRVNLDDLVRNTFVPKMQARGDHFTADQLYTHENNRDAGRIQLSLDRMGSMLRATAAELKPQYFKANYFDQHEILGPFHALFDQVFEANYHKIDLTRAQSLEARALAGKLGQDWQTSMFDMVPNDTLADLKASQEQGKFIPIRLTRDNLIQMAAHAGNESNFDKLTKGYGWKPEDVWSFLDGKLSAKDVEAVKAQWEWANKHWPEVKAQYERLGQIVPPKIEPRPYNLRLEDGSTAEMPGGYMPVRYDPLRSRLGGKQQAERVIKEGDVRLGYDFFGRDTTTNGSMNARVDGYTDAIDLHHEALERAMAETVHDLAYREPLINVNKILSHPDFKNQFFKTYGREQYDALYTWLGRIANSENIDRQVGNLGCFLHYARTGIVMTAIALRASTVLKHGGSAGIKSMGYAAGGGEKYYAARQADMARDWSGQLAEAQEKFPEIRARALQQDRDYRATVSSLFQPEGLRSKAERFGHAAVAYADLFTAVATAHGAYDRAITEGIPVNQGGTGEPMTHAQAVRYANQIVREAHGSQLEASRSNLMTSPHEGVKLFTTLYGFMNNTMGQALDLADKFRTAGLSNPVFAARAFAALVVPALWAGVLNQGWPTAKGWASWAAEALGSEAAGMIPFGRDVYAFLAGQSHAGMVGIENWLQMVTQPIKDVVHAAEGKKVSGAIAHAGDALGAGLHIPGLGQVSHTAQYLYDVHTGKQRPKNVAELVTGAAMGHGPRKEKK